MTWATGKIEETENGFRVTLNHSGEIFTTRVYNTSSSARRMAEDVAAKLGWMIDWAA